MPAPGAMLGWLPSAAAAAAVPPSSGEGALQAGRAEQGSSSSCLDLTQGVDDRFRCNARRGIAILKLPRTGSTWHVRWPLSALWSCATARMARSMAW